MVKCHNFKKMPFSFEVTNRTEYGIRRNQIDKIMRCALKVSGKTKLRLSVSIVYLGECEMRELNRRFRRVKKSTDVLSFLYSSGYNNRRGRLVSHSIDGEIVLCPKVIQRAAEARDDSFQNEHAYVLSHGILHLLGIKHSRAMYRMQDKVVASI